MRDAPGRHSGDQCGQHGQQVVAQTSRPRQRSRRRRFAAGIQNVDFQAAALAQQALDHAAGEAGAQQPRPTGADQQHVGAALDGVLDQGVAHIRGAQVDHFAAEVLGQLLGRLQVPTRGLVEYRAGIHMHQAPGQLPPLRQSAGVAHQVFGLLVAVDPDQQAAEHRRRTLAALAIAALQVGIDPRRGKLQRQFTQRGEPGQAGKDLVRRLLRQLELARAPPLQQFARRQVDEHQLVGLLHHPVGNRLVDAQAGELHHLTVETLQVLHVEGGVDVDAGGEQLLHVLPAPGVAAAGRIGMGQLGDQGQLRRIGQQTVEVELCTLAGAASGRLLRQAGEQGGRLGVRRLDQGDAQCDASG
ncbi:hypothetical protein D3C84_200430 [compost metagenome]